MDSSVAVRAHIQSELMTLMSTMFVKAVVLAEQELVMNSELYAQQRKDKGNFGMRFLTQLLSQVDL